MNHWGHFWQRQNISPSNIVIVKSILPPPGHIVEANEYSRKIWRRIKQIANEFWVRWRKEFLWSLKLRHKWNKKHRNFQNGDIVLLKTDANRNQWPMAKVVGINSDAEGFVWSVKLLIGKTRNDGEGILERPIHKIILLKESEMWFPEEDDRDVSRWFDILRGASVATNICRTDRLCNNIWMKSTTLWKLYFLEIDQCEEKTSTVAYGEMWLNSVILHWLFLLDNLILYWVMFELLLFL